MILVLHGPWVAQVSLALRPLPYYKIHLKSCDQHGSHVGPKTTLVSVYSEHKERLPPAGKFAKRVCGQLITQHRVNKQNSKGTTVDLSPNSKSGLPSHPFEGDYSWKAE